MTFISDLTELKDRNLYLNIKGKKQPMSIQFYIADDIFFFDANDIPEKVNRLEDLIYVLELEAEEDSCWSNDIYCSPMDRISGCEMRFSKDFSETTGNDIFYNCYTITSIDTTMDDIIINLK